MIHILGIHCSDRWSENRIQERRKPYLGTTSGWKRVALLFIYYFSIINKLWYTAPLAHQTLGQREKKNYRRKKKKKCPLFKRWWNNFKWKGVCNNLGKAAGRKSFAIVSLWLYMGRSLHLSRHDCGWEKVFVTDNRLTDSRGRNIA